MWPCRKIGQGQTSLIIKQNMMGHSPWCYIIEIVPLVSGKKIFKEFLLYMDMAAIFVMWPASCYLIFIFMYLKAYIQNLVKNDSVVSEKNKFLFSYVNDLGPRARDDLDLKYWLNFIFWISCLYLPIFRPLAAEVSEISIVFPFFHRKA